MKKLILASVIAGICSGTAIAAEETKETEVKDKGVRYNTAVGPYYDPIMEFAFVVIPTWSYEIGDSEKTSTSRLYGIYGSNGNWVIRGDTLNYFGDNDNWLIDGQFFYNYSKLDIENFLGGPNDSPTSEVEVDGIQGDVGLSYQILEDFYVGPTAYYGKTEYQRGADATFHSTPGVITDKNTFWYGLRGQWDKRNHIFMPTDGFFMETEIRKWDVENLNGSDFIVGVNPDGSFATANLNGTDKFYSVSADLRHYLPMGEGTTFASRARVEWKGDEAHNATTSLADVAQGFTYEIGGRSAYGANFELRHYFTEEVGMVLGASVAKATEGADEDLHYATSIGGRYVLNKEDGVVARLDITYSDQDEDELLAYFNVGETF